MAKVRFLKAPAQTFWSICTPESVREPAAPGISLGQWGMGAGGQTFPPSAPQVAVTHTLHKAALEGGSRTELRMPTVLTSSTGRPGQAFLHPCFPLHNPSSVPRGHFSKINSLKALV